MKPTPWWMDAVESTRLTMVADCGHRYTSDTFYLETRKVRGAAEVWTVCRSCKTSRSWTYGPLDMRPWRYRGISPAR